MIQRIWQVEDTELRFQLNEDGICISTDGDEWLHIDEDEFRQIVKEIFSALK